MPIVITRRNHKAGKAGNTYYRVYTHLNRTINNLKHVAYTKDFETADFINQNVNVRPFLIKHYPLYNFGQHELRNYSQAEIQNVLEK